MNIGTLLGRFLILIGLNNFRGGEIKQHENHDVLKEQLEIEKKLENFRNREKKETPLIVKRILSEGINGQVVKQVGDVCWNYYLSDTKAEVLITVQFATGEIGLASYDGFKIEHVKKGKFIWAIELLEKLPQLELDDDHVDIYIDDEYSLIAQCIDDKWSVGGEEWTGKSACKKFEEHGFSLNIERIERDE